jgi:hypothetical protein
LRVAEVKVLTWTDDNLLRQVVYEPARSSLGKICGDLIERVRFARTLRWSKHL